jgi:serine/threonine protein phosphatase PrpC
VLLCFIDKHSRLIYTATLGDSEAKIYRINDEGAIVIPLSCVRNWSSKRDAQRAANDLGEPDIAEIWPRIQDPKDLYFPFYRAKKGLNVSRALGDQLVKQYKGGMSHKAKITVHPIEPGDRLILACDGLWDYVTDNELVSLFNQFPDKEMTGELLVGYALQVAKSMDNVTVVAVDIF